MPLISTDNTLRGSYSPASLSVSTAARPLYRNPTGGEVSFFSLTRRILLPLPAFTASCAVLLLTCPAPLSSFFSRVVLSS